MSEDFTPRVFTASDGQAQGEATQQSKRRPVANVLVGLLVVGSGFYLGGTAAMGQHAIGSVQDDVAALKSKISVQEVALQNKQKDVTASATGIDLERKATDDAVAREFAQTAFTWSSLAEYQRARTAISQRFPSESMNTFIKEFMPDIKAQTDGTGKSYNVIDQEKRNSSFVSLTSNVVSINATTYNYLAVVEASSKGASSASSASKYYVLQYSVDADKKLSKLKVSVMAEAPKS